MFTHDSKLRVVVFFDFNDYSNCPNIILYHI